MTRQAPTFFFDLRASSRLQQFKLSTTKCPSILPNGRHSARALLALRVHPFDEVDAEDVARPQIWDMAEILRFTLVMGTVVVIAVFIIVFNLLVDLLYAALDPRVRYD